jgi:hypothetical protein
MRPAVHVDDAAHGAPGHGRLDPAAHRVGQGERREGVAPGDDGAALVEHEQQLVARVALAVVGEEVADGRRVVGAEERQQVGKRRQQARHEHGRSDRVRGRS